MSCEEFQQQISKLLDGMLDNDELPGVFAHLGECEECRDFFSSTVHIQRAIRAAPPVPVPERHDAIMRGIGAAHWGYRPDRAAFGLFKPRRDIRSRIGTALQLLIATILLAFLFSIRFPSQPDSSRIPPQGIGPGQLKEMELR